MIVLMHVATGALAGAVGSRRRAAVLGPVLHFACDVVPHDAIPSHAVETVAGVAAVLLLASRRGVDAATVGAVAASAPDLSTSCRCPAPAAARCSRATAGPRTRGSRVCRCGYSSRPRSPSFCTWHGDDDTPACYWHRLDDGRIQCDLCRRACRLHDGQRGLCFVRARAGERLVLTTYGCSSSCCVDPVEKKVLDHFLPGSSVLTFGTAAAHHLPLLPEPARLEVARDRHAGRERLDRPPTPPARQTCACSIAFWNGVRYAYTGNGARPGGPAWCSVCGGLVPERDRSARRLQLDRGGMLRRPTPRSRRLRRNADSVCSRMPAGRAGAMVRRRMVRQIERGVVVRRELALGVDGRVLPGAVAVPENALGIVLFAHGSGSSRLSPRNVRVSEVLVEAGLATLLFDLLTDEEAADRRKVFDVPLLAERLAAATDRLEVDPDLCHLPIGYFGASTGAAAALWAAADETRVAAVVSRGGRPDLAAARLAQVRTPTLLLVGGRDQAVLQLNRWALRLLCCNAKLRVVSGATHLFAEPGALDEVARLARDWFVRHLRACGGGLP